METLFFDGVIAFPHGFLMTAEEVERLSVEECEGILAGGTIRGIYAQDSIIGFCGYRPLGATRLRHRLALGPFFIKAEFQGEGAAQQLMAEVVAEAKAEGIRQIELSVISTNHRAIAFYERQGFRRYGEHPDAIRHDGIWHSEYLYRLVVAE